MLVNAQIAPHIVRSSSVLECISKYREALMQEGSEDSLNHADKLKEYQETITDIEFQRMLENQFYDYHALISRRFPNIQTVMEGRQKALISLDNKIVKCQKMGVPLNSIRDIMAFRVILLNKECSELTDQLYSLAELTIDFFRLKGFKICPADKTKGTSGFDKSAHPEMYVPTSPLKKSGYAKFVKDYVSTPKTKGYQSLHIVIFDPLTKRYFEIQLRTLTMHAFAETGEASHVLYEVNRIKNIKTVEIDPFQISMDGFVAIKRKNLFIDEEGVTSITEKIEITDKIGLFNSISTLLLNTRTKYVVS